MGKIEVDKCRDAQTNLIAPAVQPQAGGVDAVTMAEKFVTGNGTAALAPSQATIHAQPTSSFLWVLP